MNKWPIELLIIRHGQSEANLRKDAAKAARDEGVSPPSAWAFTHDRDMDTNLTDLGRRQGLGLGRYLGEKYPTNDVYRAGTKLGTAWPHTRYGMIEYAVVSPYVRTRQTTEMVIEGMGYSPILVIEERIREIEFGLMDGLTREGVRLKYPDEAIRRERDGKYWYRPPGGESRPDVRLRVHSFLDALNRDYVDKRVLVVCHSVVVLAFRSLIERWGEEQYMKVDQEDDCKNCGLLRYTKNPQGKLDLAEYNTVIPPYEEAK
jgi:broad specificity phosphatase PhoE